MPVNKLHLLVLLKLVAGEDVAPFIIQGLPPELRELAEQIQSTNGSDRRSQLLRKVLERIDGGKPAKLLQQVDSSAPLPGAGDLAGLDKKINSISWLWPQWILNGAISLLVAQAGSGKSWLAMCLVKSISQGTDWPDGQPYGHELGCVGWAECESGQAAIIKRRHLIHLPDRSIVFPAAEDQDMNLADPEHRARIEMLMRMPELRMLVIDSLSGSDKGRDENTAKAMGPGIGWLAKLAQDSNKAVLVIHHLRKLKDDGRRREVTIDQIRGSSIIYQYPRSIVAIDKPDARDPRFRVSVIKSNYAEKPDPFGYDFLDGVPVFDQDPPGPRVDRKTKTAEAEDWLSDFLAQHGPTEVEVVVRSAKEAGHKRRTLFRAATKLEVTRKTDPISRKTTWGK